MNYIELTLLAIAAAGLFGLCFLAYWSALGVINDRYDREVIRRSQDCNLYESYEHSESASHPTASHQHPAAVLAAVPTCEREARGTSSKPAAAGTSLHRPDGMPQNHTEARAWCRDKLRKAVAMTYVHDHAKAIELVAEAEHGLRILVLETRATAEGIVR